jgi:hypothetical protein
MRSASLPARRRSRAVLLGAARVLAMSAKAGVTFIGLPTQARRLRVHNWNREMNRSPTWTGEATAPFLIPAIASPIGGRRRLAAQRAAID